jgi:hypothetical protein
LEICGFRHGTKDYYGNIRDLFPAYTDGDVINYVKLSVGNLYHEICHRYVHGDAETNRCALPYAYKSVFFILQSVYFLKTGVYYPTKQELMRHLTDADLSIMEKGMELSRRDDYDFEEAFRSLLSWCGEVLSSF